MASSLTASITMEDWTARVRSFLLYGEPSQKMLVAQGEAGCGKSEITVQTCKKVLQEGGAVGDPIIIPGLGAQQQEELLAAVSMEKMSDGSFALVQGVIESLVPTKRLVDSGAYTLSSGRIVIPYIIDECFTGNQAQMNQLRSILSFRRIAGTKLPDEVFVIGTTNPETVAYSTRRSVDSAIMDRIELLEVSMTYAHHNRYLMQLEHEGRYPEVCRLFLNMPENNDLWPLASPRFWHAQFGLTWKELSADESMPGAARLKLFYAVLRNYFEACAMKRAMQGEESLPISAQVLLSRFIEFLEYGDDITKYPISFNRLAVAAAAHDVDEMHRQVECVRTWADSRKSALLNTTVLDIDTAFRLYDDIAEDVIDHISSILIAAGPAAASTVSQLMVTLNQASPYYWDLMSSRMSGSETWETIKQAILKTNRIKLELLEAKRAG